MCLQTKFKLLKRKSKPFHSKKKNKRSKPFNKSYFPNRQKNIQDISRFKNHQESDKTKEIGK